MARCVPVRGQGCGPGYATKLIALNVIDIEVVQAVQVVAGISANSLRRVGTVRVRMAWGVAFIYLLI